MLNLSNITLEELSKLLLDDYVDLEIEDPRILIYVYNHCVKVKTSSVSQTVQTLIS